eukprot:6477572-Pyramimonas_sp.AAC.1
MEAIEDAWLLFGFPMEAPQDPGLLLDFVWKQSKILVFFWITYGSNPRSRFSVGIPMEAIQDP